MPYTSWNLWSNFAYVDSIGVLHNFVGAVSTWPAGSSCGGGLPTSLCFRQLEFYDTLSASTPALTVSGSGSPSSPHVFSYTNPSGGTSSYDVTYKTYSVQTNFGCSGVKEYSRHSQSLVSSINLPDGTAYQFIYESTPGYSGSVTGRLQSMTLPTGGAISYAYSGGNQGITCADGSTATLTRTTPDGTWTYAHTEAGSDWATTITDPQQNQTAMQFQGIYETQRKVY